MWRKTSIIKRILRDLAWMIFNKIENNGNSNFYKNGERFFMDNLFKYFKHTGGGKKIIFDIGANIGEYSSMLLDMSQKYSVPIEVHLFEPTKSCFKLLVKKFKEINNIVVNNFGVSDSNSIATIYYDKEQSGLASLYQRNLEYYKISLNKSEKIILKRMDEYIEEKGIAHIDFIKIDIEGHELKAFESFGNYLNSDFVDFIQFEYGGANLDSHTSLMEIYKFFKERDFSIAKIMPKGLELREYAPWMENFMYSNYVAISNRILKEFSKK